MAMTTGGNGAQAQINMTPMIDVLLVLLIIFMVIIPTKSVGLDAQSPQSADSNSEPTPPSTIVIYVKAKGRAEVNRHPVDIAELGVQLMSVFHLRPESTVFVGGDPALEFRDIAHVIDVCKGVGLRRVGLLPKNSQ
jgi:biopolymer transport protein TolR